jgi:hypothetical protein
MVFVIYDAYADTSLHPAAHIQNMWTFLWASLVNLDRFDVSIMQREIEIGKIICKLSPFCFYKKSFISICIILNVRCFPFSLYQSCL